MINIHKWNLKDNMVIVDINTVQYDKKINQLVYILNSYHSSKTDNISDMFIIQNPKTKNMITVKLEKYMTTNNMNTEFIYRPTELSLEKYHHLKDLKVIIITPV